MKKIVLLRKKTYVSLFAVVSILVVFSMFAIISGSMQITQSLDAVNRVAPSVESAGSESCFQVKFAYAYVGPLPSDKDSYVDPLTNVTMVHASTFPSAVFLDFTPVFSMTSSCDAVIAVYGVKITADTGQTEYYGWSAGTGNYSTFTEDDLATLASYRAEMIQHSTYRSRGGTFCYNWAANRSVLSHTIGSIGVYTSNNTLIQQSCSDLSSSGMPNAISVDVYRVGYITMSDGSIIIHEDVLTEDKPIVSVQLDTYEDGFIYNNIVPTEQLSQIDIFHPTR
ncbi:MAG: hypothetical protein ACOWW1_00155 [archaeon]